jgi:hypothetical protein
MAKKIFEQDVEYNYLTTAKTILCQNWWGRSQMPEMQAEADDSPL